MNNAQILNISGIYLVLIISYIPVYICIGRKINLLLTMYVSTFFFRALCICGAFLNGARIGLLYGIFLAVVTEVSLLVFMSIEAEKVEALA